jgi:hypothetical protein
MASLMDLNALSRLITAFFDVYQELTVVGIVLPTGWFGRPYDNYYTLKSIDIDPENDGLSLDLSYGWRLSIKPLSAELSDSRQELTVQVESGEMLAPSVKQTFGSGDVVFCVADGKYSRAAFDANSALLEPFIR